MALHYHGIVMALSHGNAVWSGLAWSFAINEIWPQDKAYAEETPAMLKVVQLAQYQYVRELKPQAERAGLHHHRILV